MRSAYDELRVTDPDKKRPITLAPLTVATAPETQREAQARPPAAAQHAPEMWASPNDGRSNNVGCGAINPNSAGRSADDHGRVGHEVLEIAFERQTLGLHAHSRNTASP